MQIALISGGSRKAVCLNVILYLALPHLIKRFQDPLKVVTKEECSEEPSHSAWDGPTTFCPTPGLGGSCERYMVSVLHIQIGINSNRMNANCFEF